MGRKINLNHELGAPYHFTLWVTYTEDIQWFHSYCVATNTPMNKAIAEAIGEWVQTRKNNIDVLNQEINKQKAKLEKDFQLKLQSLERRQQLINETL